MERFINILCRVLENQDTDAETLLRHLNTWGFLQDEAIEYLETLCEEHWITYDGNTYSLA
jgi:hypothetical protein